MDVNDIINRLQRIREEQEVAIDDNFADHIERDYALSFAIAAIQVAMKRASDIKREAHSR